MANDTATNSPTSCTAAILMTNPVDVPKVMGDAVEEEAVLEEQPQAEASPSTTTKAAEEEEEGPPQEQPAQAVHPQQDDETPPRKPLLRMNSTTGRPSSMAATTAVTTTTTTTTNNILVRQKSLPLMAREESRRCIRQVPVPGSMSRENSKSSQMTGCSSTNASVSVSVSASSTEQHQHQHQHQQQLETAPTDAAIRLWTPLESKNSSDNSLLLDGGDNDNDNNNVNKQDHMQQDPDLMLAKLLLAVEREATNPEQGSKLAQLVETSVKKILRLAQQQQQQQQQPAEAYCPKCKNNSSSSKPSSPVPPPTFTPDITSLSQVQLGLEMTNLQRKMEELQQQKTQLMLLLSGGQEQGKDNTEQNVKEEGNGNGNDNGKCEDDGENQKDNQKNDNGGGEDSEDGDSVKSNSVVGIPQETEKETERNKNTNTNTNDDNEKEEAAPRDDGIPMEIRIELDNPNDNDKHDDTSSSDLEDKDNHFFKKRSTGKKPPVRTKSSDDDFRTWNSGDESNPAVPSRAVKALATPRRSKGKPKIKRHNSTPTPRSNGTTIATATKSTPKRTKSTDTTNANNTNTPKRSSSTKERNKDKDHHHPRHHKRNKSTDKDDSIDDKLLVRCLDEGGKPVELDMERLNQELTTFSHHGRKQAQEQQQQQQQPPQITKMASTRVLSPAKTPLRNLKKSVSARFHSQSYNNDAPLTAPVKKGTLSATINGGDGDGAGSPPLQKKKDSNNNTSNTKSAEKNNLMAPLTPGRQKVTRSFSQNDHNSKKLVAPMTAPVKKSFLGIKSLGKKMKKKGALLLDSDEDGGDSDDEEERLRDGNQKYSSKGIFASPPCSPPPSDSEFAPISNSLKKKMLLRGRGRSEDAVPPTTPVQESFHRRPRGSSLEPRDLRAMSSVFTASTTIDPSPSPQTPIRSSTLETPKPQKKSWKGIFGGHKKNMDLPGPIDDVGILSDEASDTDLDIDESIRDTDLDDDDDDENNGRYDRRRVKRMQMREELKRRSSSRALDREALTREQRSSRGRGSIERQGSRRSAERTNSRGSIERTKSSNGRGSVERKTSSRGRASVERKSSSRGRGSVERKSSRGSLERKSSSSRLRPTQYYDSSEDDGPRRAPRRSSLGNNDCPRAPRRSSLGNKEVCPETPKRDWNKRRRTSVERRKGCPPRDEMLQKGIAQLPDDPHFKVRPDLKEKWQRQDRLEDIRTKAENIKQQRMKGQY